MKIFLYSSHDMQSSHSSFLHFPVKIRVYWQYIKCGFEYSPNLSDGISGADVSFAADGGGGADIASGLSLASGAGNIFFWIYWLKGAKY